MFASNTVFVVGAGASHELNLPVGDGLMTRIIDVLKPQKPNDWRFGNDAILSALIRDLRKEHGENYGPFMQRYLEAADKIIKALPYARSIDTYLDSQKSDQYVTRLGKIAISYCILKAENDSYLAASSNTYENNDIELFKSWYAPLARMLTAGYAVHELEDVFDNVGFVVFNYDRCLEEFLERMICRYFGVSASIAARALERAEIVHAYGQCGRLRWQTSGETEANDTIVPFGGGQLDGIHGQDLNHIADKIRTYTETVDTEVGQRIKILMRNAETIAFVGFGYLRQNLDLISPEGPSLVKRILGTTYGISRDDKNAISDKLLDIFGKVGAINRLQDIQKKHRQYGEYLEAVTCRQFMDFNTFILADQ